MPWFQRICAPKSDVVSSRVEHDAEVRGLAPLGRLAGRGGTYHHTCIALAEVHGGRVEVGADSEGVDDGPDEASGRHDAVQLQARETAELHLGKPLSRIPVADLKRFEGLRARKRRDDVVQLKRGSARQFGVSLSPNSQFLLSRCRKVGDGLTRALLGYSTTAAHQLLPPYSLSSSRAR